MNATEDTIINRKTFGTLVANYEIAEKVKNNIEKRWAEERKQQHGEFMKRGEAVRQSERVLTRPITGHN